MKLAMVDFSTLWPAFVFATVLIVVVALMTRSRKRPP